MLTAKQKRKPNFFVGQSGENQAQKYLKNLGFTILDTNTQFRRTEIDIVALDNKHNEIVFVEVKKLRKGQFGHPSQAVTKKKIQKIAAVARKYIWQKRMQQDYRFDIIAVTGNKVEHFENVSWNFR